MIAQRRGALAVVVLAMMTGCAKGPIGGQLMLPGRAPEAAKISYESSLFGKTGKLSTTLPSGESFSGRYTLDPGAPDRSMTAKLEGDQGTTMTCRFTLNEPGIGPEKGGVVTCDLSSGGTFVARF